MRIGIDCRTILHPATGEQAGVAHYTYYLVKNLIRVDQKNIYVLFFDSRFKNFKEFEKENTVIRFFPFYQYKKYLPWAYSQMLVNAVLNRENLDVFHSPANVLPLSYGRPAVVTVHDLAIYKFPELFPKTLLNRQSFATKFLVPKSLTRADRVIAVSKNTKTDIIEEFGLPAEKIEVVYEGVLNLKKECPSHREADAVRKKFGVRGRFILFLGTVEPRKNIASLIRAFRNLRLIYDSPLKDCQLIIAGASGWNNSRVFEEIEEANGSILGRKTDKKAVKRIKKDLNLAEDLPVKYIGYVSHTEKVALLSLADCFVFPSLYEGFGLPVLEAMSLGKAIITSSVSSLPEVTGEKGAILVDPNRETEIGDALQQIMTDAGLKESLEINSRKRAENFSWKKCAKETLAVYQTVFAASRKR